MLNHYSYKIQAYPSKQGKFTNNSFTFLLLFTSKYGKASLLLYSFKFYFPLFTWKCQPIVSKSRQGKKDMELLTLARSARWGHNCPGNWSEWYQLDACQRIARVGVLSPLSGSSFLKRKKIGKPMTETAFPLENCLSLVEHQQPQTHLSEVSRRRKWMTISVFNTL